MALSEQPGFATAGIRLGNLNLELCAVDRQFIGLDDWLTFEPTDLDTLSTDLKARGLDHDPFDRMEAGGHPIYTEWACQGSRLRRPRCRFAVRSFQLEPPDPLHQQMKQASPKCRPSK